MLLRLPLRPLTIYKLKLRLAELTKLWTISHLIFTLISRDEDNQDSMSQVVLYNDIINSFFYLDRRLSSKFIKLLGYIILKYPKLFKNLLLYIYKTIQKRKFEENFNSNLRI